MAVDQTLNYSLFKFYILVFLCTDKHLQLKSFKCNLNAFSYRNTTNEIILNWIAKKEYGTRTVTL